MTREEAKEILTHNWTRVDNPNYAESELDEALGMAIEALSADAVEVVRCNVDHDRDWIIGCIEHDGFIHTHRFDKANQIIHDALSAEAVQGWIPCSERLPKENENVLADDGIDMFVAWYNNGWNSTDHACDPYTYIIAWMPLPKPYKGGDSE